MTSYKLRLERKKKRKDMKLGYKFISSLYWELIKSKFLPKKEFHSVIIDDIHSALESGSKEVRYYMYSNQDLYESLQDDFEFYKSNHINKDKMSYDFEVFINVKLLIKEYFKEYSEDLEFIESTGDIDSYYFGFKTKF